MTPKHEDAWLQFADRGFGLKTNLPLCQHYIMLGIVPRWHIII